MPSDVAGCFLPWGDLGMTLGGSERVRGSSGTPQVANNFAIAKYVTHAARVLVSKDGEMLAHDYDFLPPT